MICDKFANQECLFPGKSSIKADVFRIRGENRFDVHTAFHKTPGYWSLAIRLFSVISRKLVGGVLPLGIDAVGVFYSLRRLGC